MSFEYIGDDLLKKLSRYPKSSIRGNFFQHLAARCYDRLEIKIEDLVYADHFVHNLALLDKRQSFSQNLLREQVFFGQDHY
jgi:hypothetical protein